jgi:hypothetical protein
MIDKSARAMQCPRCGAWVLLGQCNGFKVAVSAEPLTPETYRSALLRGLDVYALVRGKLRGPMSSQSWTWPMHFCKAEHPCKAFTDVPLELKPAQHARWAPVCEAHTLPGGDPPGWCGRSRQEAAEGVRSCRVCDPPPFDHAEALPAADATALLVQALGARVVSMEIDGKEVYRDESLA